MSDVDRILVVDDEAPVCRSVTKVLAKEDCQVDSALSADEALKKMESKAYDVVITDLMMPKISGMELLATIKEKYPEVSVIMITGYATIKTSVQAMKLGAFDYIPKPFTPDELRSVTARAIRRKSLYLEGREPEKEPIPKLEIPPEVKGKEAVMAERVEVELAPARVEEYFYLREHSWASVEKDGSVRIGMDYIFQKTAGEILYIDLPLEDEEIEQGGVCARVTSKERRIHKLWAPISGKVVEVNSELDKEASLASSDPYGKGWLMRIEPSNLEEELKILARGKDIS
ncbi:MAG: response regulator [Deltaproteobacteria bacterium]|nr:MAG: response regulator [Deltaproteobacteria bacterium]